MKSLTALTEKFREALAHFLWDQWVSLGVAGSSRIGPVPFAIDPEALLLATTRFGFGDPRVIGEALDWLDQNGKMISIQRVKNLQRNFLIGELSHLMDIAYFLTRSGHKNWTSLFALAKQSNQHGRSDSIEEDVELRQMSQKPHPNHSEAFIFKMRSFFGMNARAEVFTWLLTHGGGHAAAIARDTVWFSKTVQLILNELEQSGLVFVRERKEDDVERRAKVFHLDHDQWEFLVSEQQELNWFSQAPFYLGCAHVVDILCSLTESPESSPHYRAIKIRERLTSTAVSFERAGMPDLFSGSAHLSGEELVDLFQRDTEQILFSVLKRRSFPLGPSFPMTQRRQKSPV